MRKILLGVVLYKALSYLTPSYNAVIGRVEPRRQQAWLKPMSGERRAIEVRHPLNAVERIVIATVAGAVLLFEVWFLFAHLALPSELRAPGARTAATSVGWSPNVASTPAFPRPRDEMVVPRPRRRA